MSQLTISEKCFVSKFLEIRSLWRKIACIIPVPDATGGEKGPIMVPLYI